ncbi:MAG: autotransporter assembly complex family protein [Gammaproteobacteria bacterium]
MLTRKTRKTGTWLDLCLCLCLVLTATSAGADHIIVDITGVDSDLEKKLLNDITLTRQNKLEKLTLARMKSLFSRARKEIRSSLQARGYYQPEIEAKLSDEDENSKHRRASFHIEPGPRTHVTELTLEILGEGRNDDRLLAQVDNFPLQEGDPLIHSLYESGKKKIETLAGERGYFDAGWKTNVVRVNVNKNSARIELRYDTGNRYHFGDIKIPDTVVSRNIIEKMLPFQRGDPYDANLLIALTQALRNSDYFADVLVKPEVNNLNDEQVPITISLTPRARNSYRVGGGFGTDTGPRLVGSWDNRYFNKKGHRIETDLRLSLVLSSLTGSYLIPYFRNRDAELGVTSSIAHEDTDSRKNDTFKTGIQHLRQRWGWNETLGLTYQYESFELADTREATHLLIPRIGYTKTVTDNPVYTRNGYRIGMELRGAVEGVVSDLSFLQANIRGKYIRSLGENGRIIARSKVGGTVVSNFDELPASLRFFAGGDNSVRGFDFEALGPRDSQGNVLGGRYVLTGSLEYEHRFLEKWSGAVFTDIGNAFNDLDDYELEYSVGAGIRWLTPVGLIRLDVAAGISRDDTPIRLHIVVGPDL